MMKASSEQRMREHLELVTSCLENDCFAYSDEPQQILFDSIRYSLLAGGKRLRPVLVLEFCSICGGDPKTALPLAAAIEMIHTYSLIHDDLPSMDNDDLRRGRPTNHIVYGEAMAILAGDALLTEAFHAAADAKLPDSRKVEAIRVLSRCAGGVGMVGGQVLDILSEERECTEQEILDIQIRKTGALIRAACQMGVLAGGGSEFQISAAAEFADHLGLAFQIRDDMLDVIGEASVLGKATGVDGEKNTFVRLYGLEKCEELVQLHTRKAIEALSVFESTDFLVDLAYSLTARNF